MSPTSYRTAPSCGDQKRKNQKMAGVQGFEPRLDGPKPPVLPLDDTPIIFETEIIAELNRFVN